MDIEKEIKKYFKVNDIFIKHNRKRSFTRLIYVHLKLLIEKDKVVFSNQISKDQLYYLMSTRKEKLKNEYFKSIYLSFLNHLFTNHYKLIAIYDTQYNGK